MRVTSHAGDLQRRLVRALQQATLPNRLASVEGASLSAVYRPAASKVQVGGDWYDAFDLDEHKVLLTVGDVTGHGLHASIIMRKLRQGINVIGTRPTLWLVQRLGARLDVEVLPGYGAHVQAILPIRRV